MDLQTILTSILSFISDSIIPFLMVVALFFFLWNAVRYFIIGGANPDDQEKARSLAIWGVAAFFVITAVWGIVSLLSSSFGIEGASPVLPDYLEKWCEERLADGPPTCEVARQCGMPTDRCDP